MRKLTLGVGILLCLGAAFFGFRIAEKGRYTGSWATAISRNYTKLYAQSRPVDSQPRSSRPYANQYSSLPLAFEPNVGQTVNDVKFLARGDGYLVYLTPHESVFILKASPPGDALGHVKPESSAQRLLARTAEASVIRMELVGGSTDSDFVPEGQLLGKSNYLVGNQAVNWRVNVPTYRKVEERSAYPGIDLVYYGTQRQLEYDFVVAPRADPKVIRLAIKGANKLRIDAQGELKVGVAGGELSFHKPVAYQETNGTKQFVAANYALEASGVVFEVGSYDLSRPLVIDPILSYSTYLGGGGIDGGNAIAVAPDNTAFITGGTFSADFPTAHPLQPNVGGPFDFPQDAFVSKISADGSQLLYSTYLGGKASDTGSGIAVDNFGDAYVTGTTLSSDFPVTPGSFNTLCGGDGQCGASYNPNGLIVSAAFVTKLNPAGSALIYSGFLGYYENVKGQAIAVDADQNAYVTGQTARNGMPSVVPPPNVPPPPFPITTSAFQPGFGGDPTDAFVTKISASGTSFLYSSYLGGTAEDIGYAIAVDTVQNAYVTGLTYSTSNFPLAAATQGANGGAGDAFVAKVNTSASGGASLVFSTFLGGVGLDQGNGIAVDTSGNAYVTGLASSNGLATTGQFQTANAGQGDAFVAKYTPAGALSYLTYLGGSKADQGAGIAVDSAGNAYVTGSTVSTDFPVITPTLQPNYGGGNADAFVTKLDPAGATLVYSSYLGGSNTESGNGIALDAGGSSYVTGQTCSEDFPIANPLFSTPGGNCDGFVSKISILNGIALNPSGLSFPSLSIGTTSQAQTVILTNGDSPLTISGITVTGANSADFAETNTCGTALAAGAQCTISVTFTPGAAGLRKAMIEITDSAPGSPQVISLTGSTSAVTLSSSDLSFGNSQQVGVASAPQSVTVTNNGSTPLTISSIAASGDFTETNNCTAAPLQPGTNCVINVVFTPSTAGSSIGALTITDNAAGSPQVVLLTGTGAGLQNDFAVTPSSSTVTVSAGQTATYTLQVTSFGTLTQPIALACAGLPPLSTCSFSPNPVSPSGSTPTPVTLTISTAVRNLVPPNFRFKTDPFVGLRYFWPALISLLVILLLAALHGPQRKRLMAGSGVAVVFLLIVVGCGGGNATGVPAGTPAGTYTIVVTTTSGSITHTTNLVLQVK